MCSPREDSRDSSIPHCPAVPEAEGIAQNESLITPVTSVSEMCHYEETEIIPQKNITFNKIFH